MKILISGGSGMVGGALFWALHKEGHEVVGLVRNVGDSAGTDLIWNPKTGETDMPRFEGFDAVVHLAGESIAAGRWTKAKKERIRNSRVMDTQNLSRILAGLKNPPAVYVCASAIGFYGDRAEAVLDEQSAPGTGFLPDVCKEWEAATTPATDKGIRTVNLRFGIILSPKGGALQKMLLPFKLGLGGVIGSGKQWMSWVALDDVVGAIQQTIADKNLSGAVNVVSPEPVRNESFTRTLGDVLVRPTILPMPAFAARLALGEMADALLLASANVAPKKLQASGYAFALPKLEPALRRLLSR